MMHRAWSSIVEVPFCFSRSYVKFQGHTALKIVEFDPNWSFPDCNSSLNSPMAMKCCTKLETEKERSPIVFQGHPSNFKVTRDKTSPILTQIGRFRTIGRSQLSNPSDLHCYDLCWLTKAPVGMIWVRGVWCGFGTFVWPSFRTHSCITRHYFLKFDVYSSGDMRKIQRKDLMIHDSTNCPYWSPLDLLGLLTFLAFMDLGVRSCKVPKATVIVLSDICWLFCENESPHIRTFFYIRVTIRVT